MSRHYGYSYVNLLNEYKVHIFMFIETHNNKVAVMIVKYITAFLFFFFFAVYFYISIKF